MLRVARKVRNEVRMRRFAKRGFPAVLCDQTFRFKLGHQPHTNLTGRLWEEDRLLMRCYSEAIAPGHVVLDLGAFVGYYTLLAARRVGPLGKVIAFEPCPASYKALLHHLMLNDLLDRVQAWQMAASDKDGFVKIFFQEHDPVRGHNATHPLSFEQQGLATNLSHEIVPCVNLGHFLDSLHVKADVVKIDVEGGEIDVLKSIVALLQSSAVIFCELHPELWVDRAVKEADLLSLLKQTGRSLESLRGEPVLDLRYGPVVLKKKHHVSRQSHQKVSGVSVGNRGKERCCSRTSNQNQR
jgi:FkbM family methyltransferase